jgi:preprotein translocase subunit SecG
MLLFLMFVLAIILSLAVCVYVLLQQQSPRPPKAKGGHNNGPPRKVLPVR